MRNPDYFARYLNQQKPHSLWIGYSDSRVLAEVLTSSHPGEQFVHRNIANMVVPDDDNLVSVLQYAIFYLGVQAALGLPASPLAKEDSAWPDALLHCAELCNMGWLNYHASAADEEESSKFNRLVETNVIAQFAGLVASESVRQAWQAG